MSTSIEYTLPKNKSQREFIKAKFAHQARRWWGLWNWGHPIPRLLNQKSNEFKLELIFDAEKSLDRELTLEEASFAFFRFRWEYLRLLETIALPDTEIDLVWSYSTSGNNTNNIPRILIMPSLSSENTGPGNKLNNINDDATIMQKTWKILETATPSVGGGGEIARLLKTEIPVDTSFKYRNFDTFSSEELELTFVSHHSDSRLKPAIKSKSGKLWFINLTRKGFRLGDELDVQNFQTLEYASFPLVIKESGKITQGIQNTWYNMLGGWMGENDAAVDLITEVCRLSELLEEYRLVYPVTRVDDHHAKPEKGHYIYRIDRTASHPIWGETKRPDSFELVDTLYRNYDKETPEVTIGNEVPHIKGKATFRLVRVHDDDPDLVLLKGRNAPDTGWLKPVDNGTQALIRRKETFQRRAMQSRSLSKLFTATVEKSREFWDKNSMWDGRWRLDSKGPLHLVIGPPGTGKTWTAVRLVEDILEREPHARILVCAKEHFALNHLAMSIRNAFKSNSNLTHHKLVRILPTSKEESAFTGDYEGLNEVKPERVGRRVWRPRIIAGSKYDDFKNLWSEINRDISGLTAPWVAQSAIEEASVFCTTTMDRSLGELLSQPQPPTFDYVLIEEAGKAYPSELMAPMSLSRQWVLIGDDRQLPPYKLVDTRKNIEKILNLDYEKLKKNTDPHLAVLFDKFRRDHLDAGNYEDTATWLKPFNNLKLFAERVGEKTHFLNHQYRMEKELSNIISNVFYGTTFEYKKAKRTWKRPKNRLLSGENPLIWVDTPSAVENKKWSESMKYRNVKEAKIVSNIVNALSPKDVDVKILTPYNSQKSHLQKTLQKYRRWICTVDEFQGREADIIILSLVRNNRSTISGRRWGFLRDPTRLNVMFSRAREILVVVGSLTHIFDTEFYPDETELRDVAERFRSKAKIIKPDDISREMEL